MSMINVDILAHCTYSVSPVWNNIYL